MHHGVLRVLLRQHFGKERPLFGIEIGTACGDSAFSILDEMPNCTLWSIDPWLHVPGRHFEAGEKQQYHDKNRESAIKRLRQYGDRVHIYRMTSKRAFDCLCGQKYDFVWVDGDHSPDAVSFDIDNYIRLVKTGGFLGGHDYGLVHPLTEIIYERFFKELNTGEDYTWWVYR